jgi:hypothetical protein
MEYAYGAAIGVVIVTLAALGFGWVLFRILAKKASNKDHSDAIRRRGRLVLLVGLGVGSVAFVAAILGLFSPKPLGLIDRAMQNYHEICLDDGVAENTCTAMVNCLRPGWEAALTDARIVEIEAKGHASAFTTEETRAIEAVESKCRAEHLN